MSNDTSATLDRILEVYIEEIDKTSLKRAECYCFQRRVGERPGESEVMLVARLRAAARHMTHDIYTSYSMDLVRLSAQENIGAVKDTIVTTVQLIGSAGPSTGPLGSDWQGTVYHVKMFFS